ncbi:subtilisin-like protein [Diplogelasinospora grovesii]|uniref:tripeptidyl-peptidase II n=1 Tax=Diplogelasinospora grovesii TaxID=303347 RepID=A0AAN6MXS5_9PEZI|nr:subtilisin-like protein [Diplogelasinospora grovesii]
MSKVTALPAGVRAVSIPSGDQIMTLQIGLKLQNIDQLEGRLRAVSTPGSPQYGKYLDAKEVNELFKPSTKSQAAVTSWLKSSGVRDEDIEYFGGYMNFATNVSSANTLLSTAFQNFVVEGALKLRTLRYSVPDEMAEHIEVISPTTFLGKTHVHSPIMIHPPIGDRRHSSRSIDAQQVDCSRLIVPACLERMYNYGTYKESATSGSRVGFGSFLNESAIQSDLTMYQRLYGLPPTNFSTTLINGGVDHQDPRITVGEANLDSQFMSAVAKTLPVRQFITAGKPPFIPNLNLPDAAHNTNEPYLEYYNFLLNQTNAQIPQVISHSYGDDEQTVPREYATRVCNQIGMMGLRGVSVLQSSGDTGVGAPCQSNDGRRSPEFTPQFPGSCPYITAVGGTQAYNPEVAWDASGGGFSNYFARAWYQQDTVSDYLVNHIAPETKQYYVDYTNFSGRAFPDISAHSLTPNYQYIFSMQLGQTGGTSAAAPVVAGIIGLLNDARLRAGQPVMGFINPWLYSVGYKGLTDIVAGKARGCTGVNLQTGRPMLTASVIPWASWNATVGWDPATGLGVPDFQAMLKLALSV